MLKVLLITALESAAFFAALLWFVGHQRRRTPIDKSLRLYQGLAFVALALVLVSVALVLQSLNTTSWFASVDEAAPTGITIAALLYVIPAVAAAIGANILTEYVTAGP
jgi:hypothetical protein